jgi:hypothetical protein
MPRIQLALVLTLVAIGCDAPGAPSASTAQAILRPPTCQPQQIEVCSTVDCGEVLHCPPPTCYCDFDPLKAAPSQFQLLIIAPQAFYSTLMESFVPHKNAIGMTAYVVTMEGLRLEYNPGADDALLIKQLIARAAQDHGVKYVLLAGDTTLVPVRNYTVYPLPGGSGIFTNELYIPTDFYYANLWTNRDCLGNPGAFSTWDADGDGQYDVVYGSNSVPTPTSEDAVHFNPDDVDGYPDVAVGRVPAGSTVDLSTYLAKVIAYEGSSSLPAGTYGLVVDGNYPSATDYAQWSIHAAGLDAAVAPTLRKLAVNYATPPAGWVGGGDSDIMTLWGQQEWITYFGHGATWGWDTFHQYWTQPNPPVVIASACDTGFFAPLVPDNKYLGTDGREHQISWDATAGTATDTIQGVALGFPFTPPKRSIYDNADTMVHGFGYQSIMSNLGAIAYIGADQTTQVGKPAYVTQAMLAAYAKQGQRVLGDIYLSGLRAYYALNQTSGDYFTAPRVFLNFMELQGDPSLRMP